MAIDVHHIESQLTREESPVLPGAFSALPGGALVCSSLRDMPLILDADTHYVEAPLGVSSYEQMFARFIKRSGALFQDPYHAESQSGVLCFGAYELSPEAIRPLLDRAFPLSFFSAEDVAVRERFIQSLVVLNSAWDELFPNGDVHFIFRLNQIKDTSYATYHRDSAPLTGVWNLMGDGTRCVLDGINENRFLNATFEDAGSFASKEHTHRVLQPGSFCLFDDTLTHAAAKPSSSNLSWRAVALWELAEGCLPKSDDRQWHRLWENLDDLLT